MVRHNCLYWFTGLDAQAACCRADLAVSFLLHSRSASSPTPPPPQVQELGSEPQTWTPAVGAEGKGSLLPCLGMNPGPGHRQASWAVEPARGCPGMGHCGGRGDALEAEGLAPPTGQHPDLHLSGSWLRHGDWAVLRQRARG